VRWESPLEHPLEPAPLNEKMKINNALGEMSLAKNGRKNMTTLQRRHARARGRVVIGTTSGLNMHRASVFIGASCGLLAPV
jgi:hypothetical protein